MRLSIALLVFFILFNAWGGLMQQYHVDDRLGINAETGNPQELRKATDAAGSISTGSPIGQTLLSYYNNLLNTVFGVIKGLQPGVQLLVNVLPPGIAEDFVVWMAAILPIMSVVDLAYFARGGGL
jgi:hypothetical protein